MRLMAEVFHDKQTERVERDIGEGEVVDSGADS